MLDELCHMKRLAIGLPDEAFFQRKPEKGLITKAEIRALSVARLSPGLGDVIWDIGTATGSVAIEAAMFVGTEGKVFALEKNAEDVEIARQNVAKFELEHVIEVIHGRAPQALAQIKADPDAVFIGGSGGEMAEVIRTSLTRMRPDGRLVINAITLDNLSAALDTLKSVGIKFDVTLVQVSRSKPILDLLRFEALNPIFIISAVKSGPRSGTQEGA
jgi:precorrin-6Y C5,15-methyltransferase (decarboxylating)